MFSEGIEMDHWLEMSERDRYDKWNFLDIKGRSIFLKNKPAGIYLFKCINRSTGTMYEIYLKLTIKTPE